MKYILGTLIVFSALYTCAQNDPVYGIDYHQVLKVQDSILLNHPGDCYALFNRATAFRKLERYEESIADISFVIKECKDSSHSNLYSRAKAYQSLHRYNEAIQDYQTAIHDLWIHSESISDCCFQIGFCFAQQEKYNEAVEWYTKALGSSDAKGMCYYNRGLCYYNLGDLEHACKDLDMAYTYGIKQAEETRKDLCKNYHPAK